jgi:hypothetical protein
VSLRTAFTRNLPLKLTSLVLALFLWFLAASEEPATTLVPVEVTIKPPPGRSMIRPPEMLRALVIGSRRELLKLSTGPLHFTRTLPDTLQADEVRLDLVPGDLEPPRGANVRVQDLQPRTLVLELDSTYHRVVPVRPVVQLRSEPGFALGGIAVVPGTVRLMGPGQQVRLLDSVRTQPLEITRADAPVDELVPVDTTGLGPVRVWPATVTVRVNVEAASERTLWPVPVRLSSTTSAALRPEQESVIVRVLGSAARLVGLVPDSVLVVVDGVGETEPRRAPLRVLLPPGLQGRAEPDSVDLVRRRPRG